MDLRPPQQDADRARHLPALQAMDAQETPCRRAQSTHCRHAINRLKRPDIAGRMIPGNWEGDLIIGKDGASACATLVERTTRYLIIVALPLGRRADQVCDALTRRIQGLPEGAMRTLTWDQGPEMARHQRASHARLLDRRPGAQWGQGAVDFDGDALECAAGVLGVASEPAPRVGAGTDDPGLVGGEDGALAFG